MTPRPKPMTEAATSAAPHISTPMKMATANSLPNTSVETWPLQARSPRMAIATTKTERCIPNAPGTGLGLDNNCNGVIDSDEEDVPVCPEDVTQDGTVTVADVLRARRIWMCAANGLRQRCGWQQRRHRQ